MILSFGVGICCYYSYWKGKKDNTKKEKEIEEKEKQQRQEQEQEQKEKINRFLQSLWLTLLTNPNCIRSYIILNSAIIKTDYRKKTYSNFPIQIYTLRTSHSHVTCNFIMANDENSFHVQENYLSLLFFNKQTRRILHLERPMELQKFFSSLLTTFIFHDIWPHLESMQPFWFQDHTKHYDRICKGIFFDFPILNENQDDLICASCGASIDLSWRLDIARTKHEQFQQVIEQRRNKIWKIWLSMNNNSFIEWLPEELVEAILEILLNDFDDSKKNSYFSFRSILMPLDCKYPFR
jgi:hypothetical protein